MKQQIKARPMILIFAEGSCQPPSLLKSRQKKMNDGQQKCVVAKSNPKSFYPRSELEQKMRRSLRQNDTDSCAECHQQIYKPEVSVRPKADNGDNTYNR